MILYIVFIIGGTYAYYSYKNSASGGITGDMALADAKLTVERIVPEGNDLALVPLIDSHLDNALKGTGGVSSCIDGNSNLSCEVYKIVIKNTGTANLQLNGTVTLVASGEGNVFHNLKWETIENPTTRKSQYLTNGMGISSLEENLKLASGDSKTYYIAVWLSENNKDQRETDKGTFGGMVNFADSNGQGVTAVFHEFDKDFCTNEGITKLSDCLLVSEKYSNSVEDAKTYISSKVADFNNPAPISIYTEKKESNITNSNGVFSSTNQIQVGTDYTFDKETGLYNLKNYSYKIMTDVKSDAKTKYYTCGSTGRLNCSTMYVLYDSTSSTSGGITTYKATKVDRYTQNVTVSNLSDRGLYKTLDDDGDSYYYRGKVDNNYVSYAGYIWRIVRINGDGSIKLIYSGTSTSDTGSKTSIDTSSYNTQRQDMAFVGYRYGLNQIKKDTTNTLTYNNISATTDYYYSNSYECDDATKTCKLTGDITSMKHGIWSDTYKIVLGMNETGEIDRTKAYPYTCWSTSALENCTMISEITGIVTTNNKINPTQARVKYHGYLSKSYEDTYIDNKDSTIKEKIDSWYERNIKNKSDKNGVSYAEYLEDVVFCNDRSITSGDGSTLNASTIYGPYTRIYSNKTPNLICPRDEDKFTVSSRKGNGKLTYSVGLITIDEASMAGGKHANMNSLFYLYTGQTYWTMSPSDFNASSAHAYVWNTSSTGILGTSWSTTAHGVRPVVNLKSDILITEGNGTMIAPYQIGY